MKPLRLVISGGMGSGKSTVGWMLADRDFAVLDADKVGHWVLSGDNPVAVQVTERWPEVAVRGVVDRKLLGDIVFDDPAQLAELEALTHPAIKERIIRWAQQVGGRSAAVEIPVPANLVDEQGWIKVVVDAPLDVRKTRLRERGMSEENIDKRLASQPSPTEWREAADYVITNSGNRKSLGESLDNTLAQIRADLEA
ncbi:MAG: dephospho-CoA kinase [Acidimicrobiia bacterium]|nr:dephospho-CoA kinase [bacterium]MXX63922.1 dephospho-CoA kinase [Acidimicrobiia bacterium]MXZ06644.1 dephospho-CoA kinase [Acidimicrobiia bacterium]